MKAIMIIDLPDGINVDKLCKTPVSLTFQLQSCKQTWYENGYLRPMPQKKNSIVYQGEVNVDIPVDFLEKIHNQGYNDCLDEILGDEE